MPDLSLARQRKRCECHLQTKLDVGVSLILSEELLTGHVDIPPSSREGIK